MINKQCPSVADAVADIPDGATVMVGGFGASCSPVELLHALIDHGATDLTVINNNTGNGEVGLAALIGIPEELPNDRPDRRTAIGQDRQGRLLLILAPRGGLTLHAFGTYGLILRFLARLNPAKFYPTVAAAPLLAFSTSSSNATLPLTIETAEEKVGVSNEVASFVLPLAQQEMVA